MSRHERGVGALMPPALTPASIRSLLDAHGVTPSRALGQHFLADPNTAARIVRLAGVEPGDRVVEVGPGVGSLTVALCDAGTSVVAIELDRHVVPALEEVVAGLPVRVVQGDALQLDWRATLGDVEGWAMVANLPYNVATPLVVRALESAPMIDRFLVMMQREVGERLAAAPGSRVYGAVSVRVAYYAEADVVGVVPPTVFVPRPKVDSALVRLVRRSRPPVTVPDVDRMFELVRAGFATRRKTLRRALATVFGDRATATLEAAGIDPAARAETLSLEQWAALARADHSAS
jgi:16S rRNA (adenine1518-N6/adenine1519-N6)-dimethyltransferase